MAKSMSSRKLNMLRIETLLECGWKRHLCTVFVILVLYHYWLSSLSCAYSLLEISAIETEMAFS
jgi:hypothetical protein